MDLGFGERGLIALVMLVAVILTACAESRSSGEIVPLTNIPVPTWTSTPTGSAAAHTADMPVLPASTPVSPTPAPMPPTQRPRPTPTPIPPTATATPKPMVMINNEMNVRQGPGTGYPVTGTASPGQQYPITGKDPGGDWWKINYNGQTGWVYASLVTATNAEDVRIAAQPTSTPRPRPTSTPRPRATRTPRQPTTTQIAFANAILPISTMHAEATADLTALLEFPLFGNDEWTSDVAVTLVLIQMAYDAALEISPPPSLRNVHGTWLAGLQRCSQAAGMIASGIDSLDIRELDRAIELQLECTLLIMEANRLLGEAIP